MDYGRGSRRLSIRAVFHLQNGTLEVKENDGQITWDWKDMNTIVLEEAFQRILAVRESEQFDVSSLSTLMDRFHGLCSEWVDVNSL